MLRINLSTYFYRHRRDDQAALMLRLKELEALETIAGKVERLTIHNGTGGLMNDLVKLRDA